MANTTDQQYYNHLLDIKEKMEDFLSKVDNGKKTYLIDLALKMRILLIRKSGTNPLFQSIMEKFNFRLNVFFKESMIEAIKNGSLPSSLLDKMIISYSNNAMN